MAVLMQTRLPLSYLNTSTWTTETARRSRFGDYNRLGLRIQLCTVRFFRDRGASAAVAVQRHQGRDGARLPLPQHLRPGRIARKRQRRAGSPASEQYKIFLIGALAGLRRNEIDVLPWTAFRFQNAAPPH
jgi:hypothetical protein